MTRPMLCSVILLSLSCLVSERGTSQASQASAAAEARDSTRASLMRDLGYLASSKFEGRATGSAGSDSAAQYLANAYIGMAVDALLQTGQCDASGACRHTYFQSFHPPSTPLQRAGIRDDAIARNVVAWVPGTDSAVRGQYIVIGGHYDHLGRTGYGAVDGGTAREPHLGADDNASGTAAVLELARRIANSPLRRPVIIVNFGAEELGLFGSKFFVAQAPVPLDSIVAMFNFDMVGHLTGGPLQLFGMASSGDWKAVVDSAVARVPVPLDRHENVSPWAGGSDHAPFDNVGVPNMHYFTGLHNAYHTKFDTVDRIDFAGLMRVIDFGEQMIRRVGDAVAGPRRLTAK